MTSLKPLNYSPKAENQAIYNQLYGFTANCTMPSAALASALTFPE
jgi:hypothetical protein